MRKKRPRSPCRGNQPDSERSTSYTKKRLRKNCAKWERRVRIVASIDESLAEHRIHIVCVRRFVFFVTADCVQHEVVLVANAALFLCGLPPFR